MKENKENPLNIWSKESRGYYMIGEKNIPLAYVKWFKRCCEWSYQRITKGYCEGDIWSMESHLENLIPSMLQELKETRHGSPARLGEDYVNEKGILCNDTCHEEWDKVLDKMIYLWHEAVEETCTQTNPFQEEYDKASSEFDEKYGLFGEKLMTEEQKKNPIGKTMHFMDELPEYKTIHDNYREAQRGLERYRSECKDEALELLKEYWYDLWD